MEEDDLNVALPDETEIEEPTEPVEPAPPQPSKYEAEARSQGWVPKEEWNGDPDDWTDAREFVKRGELFHRISNQSSEIKELKKTLNHLVEHHSKVKETEFNNALNYLKQEKKRALEEGNADQLLAVDDAIDLLKEEKRQEESKPQPTAPQVSNNFVQWVNNNQWYVKDQELRDFADDFGVGYKSRHPEITELELYQLTKERVMRAFPDKFKGKGPSTPSVEGTNNAPAAKKDSFSLTSEERAIMKNFVRLGVLTEEQYIADLKKVRGS